ncbi:ATPase AAA domain-containing protein 5 [Balamuthia mandrillaris]
MVYACAQEHHYRILEVNSAIRTDGRKIIQLFSEATQSHHLSCAKTVPSQEPQETSPSLEHSLVLFEEVDVVFDQDKGFFTAVAALIREPKRPIEPACSKHSRDQVNFVHRRIKEHLVPLHQRGSQEEMLEFISWVEHMVLLDKAAPLTTKRRRFVLTI